MSASAPRARGPIAEFAKFLELQNLGLNLPFLLAFLVVAVGGVPSLRLAGLTLVAFVAARNAGHAFNRWADRGYDAANPRTQDRALVTGRYAPSTALAIAGANAGLLLLAAYFLNEVAFLLAPVALLLLFGYSYSKRYSSATTVYLGVVEAATPAGAYLAATATLPWSVLPAIGAVLLLGTAFETIHSLGDLEDDRAQGLRSIPVAIGAASSRRLVPALHLASLVLFAAYGLAAGLGAGILVVVAAMAIVTSVVDGLVARGPEDPRVPFRLHFLLGPILLVGVVALELLR